jgi:hypothetical protein
LRRIAVDANVFVSFFIDRNAAQHAAARALIQQAEDGEIAAIVPQAVVFEVAYVVQSQYAITGDRLATVIKGVTSFPGTQVVDECRWKSVLEIWPDPLSGLGDSLSSRPQWRRAAMPSRHSIASLRTSSRPSASLPTGELSAGASGPRSTLRALHVNRAARSCE